MASLTIEQIAVLAQISRSTVSRVLNNHPNVRPAVRERVLRVVSEQGYAPHAAARSLARRRTNVIGLIMPRRAEVSLSDPFFGLVMQTIIEASARFGYFVTLSKVTADIEQDFPRRVLYGQHFDGVITFATDPNDPLLPLLKQSKTPLVVLGSHPQFADITSVDVQQREGAYHAVNHLLSLGHRRIAMITGLLHDPAAVGRRDGYAQALEAAGLPVAPELIVEGDWTPQRGYTAMQHLLGLPQRPSAVFVANDMMAVGAIRAINEAGLTVPHDVALVSFDDLPVASYANPPLTTIRAPIADGGATAVKLLVDQLEQRDTSVTHVRLPTKLIIRASCGATALSRT
jgi:LacI family transcriptional regulator